MDPEFKLLREFATDVMKFALAMNGYEYAGLFEIRAEWVPDTFEYVFGQAVFYYRETHRERFEELLQSYHDLIFHDEATLLEYIKFGIQKVTKGDSLLMDFLRILAFYADLIIYCQRFDNRSTFVALVTNYFTEIYNYAGIRDVLQVSGSYGFLRRVAEEIIGPRYNEESFESRIMRYRQQLEQGTPDQRRVSFAVPEASERVIPNGSSSSAAGRLASCLGMFACVSANHTEENGLTDQDNLLESKPGPSNVDFSVPSTSGTFVRASSSTESEDDESERCRFRKESIPEIKKPQSILKSPHGIKGHKRSASDENESNRKKRTRIICSDESNPGKEDKDPKTPPEEILIPISDTISDELRISLDKILKEILIYNKTSGEPVVYDVNSDSPESNSKLPEEHGIDETDNIKILITNSDNSSVPFEGSEAAMVSKTGDSLKVEVEDDSLKTKMVDDPACKSDVQAAIDETKMDTEDCNISSKENKTEVNKCDDSFKVESDGDFGCSNSKEELKTRIESVRLDISFDSYVESENLETKLPEENKQTEAEHFNTPTTDSTEVIKVEISSDKSNPPEESKTELNEMSMNLGDCNIDSGSQETRLGESDESEKIVKSGDSVSKIEVSEDVQIEMDSDSCNMSCKSSETGISKLEDSLKIVNNADCACVSYASKDDQVKVETKINSEDNTVSQSLDPDVNEIVSSIDTIHKSDVKAESSEIKMDSDDSMVIFESYEVSVNKPGVYEEIVVSGDWICEFKNPEDVQVEICDTDSDNRSSEVSEAGVSKPEASSNIVNSNASVCKLDISKDVQEEVCDMDADNRKMSSEVSEAVVSEPDASSQIISSNASVWELDISKHVQEEVCDMDADNRKTSSEVSEAVVSKPDASSKIINSSASALKLDTSKDIKAESGEIKMDSVDVQVSENSGKDANEFVTSSDSMCKLDAPRDIQTQISDTKIDLDKCNVPSESFETSISETGDSSKNVTSCDSEYSNQNRDFSAETDIVKIDPGSDSSDHAENMECD